ncbi:hypothetical protein HY251_09470 [bacterium]|nr:hypothetical protein [bacterium]
MCAAAARGFYDQNASLFLVLGVALLEIDLPLPPAKRAVVLGLATGALVGLSALTKANTAAFGALAFLLPMALPGERLRALASFGAALAATVLLGILPFADPRDAFEQMRAFAGSTDRFGNLDRLVETLVATPFVPLLVLGLAVALARGREFVRANGDRLLRFLGLLLGSILATWTSSGNAETKFPLLGIQALYVVLLGWSSGKPRRSPGRSSGWRAVPARRGSSSPSLTRSRA